MRTLLSTIAICLLLTGVGLPASAGGEIDALRAEFDAVVTVQEKTFAEKAGACEREYQGELLRLEAACQAEGNLEELLVVRKERERFAGDKMITKAHLVSSPAALRALQEKYINLPQELAVARSRAVLAAGDAYTAKLAELQKSLTTANRIEEAVAVKQARERFRDDAAMAAARFEVDAYTAEHGSPSSAAEAKADTKPAAKPEAGRTEKPASSQASAPPPGGASTVGAKSETKPADGFGEYLGVKIYSDRKLIAERIRDDMKMLNMLRTPIAPMKATLAVKAWGSKDPGGTREGSRGGKGDSGGFSLRLSLATIQKRPLANVIVVVQYYTRSTGDMGTIDPSEQLTKRVPLGRIVGEPVILDFPPFDASRQRRHQWSDGSRQEGAEFYGVIVGVYDAAGALVYQAASHRNLFSKAPQSIPPKTLEERVLELRQAAQRAEQDRRQAYQQFVKNQDNDGLRQAYERANQRAQNAQSELESAAQQLRMRE